MLGIFVLIIILIPIMVWAGMESQPSANQTGYATNYFYWNFTTQGNASGFIAEVQHGELSKYNITIPSTDDCWNISSKMQIRAYSIGANTAGQSSFQCYNSTAWKLIGTNYSITVTGTASYTTNNPPTLFDDNNFATFDVWVGTTAKSGISCAIGNCSGSYAGRVYDLNGFWNVTTAAANSCTYSSGNWMIQCSDACTLTTNTDLNKNNITFNGTGTITITANITNFTLATAQNNCVVIAKNGNKLGG